MNDAFLLCHDFKLSKHKHLKPIEAEALVSLMDYTHQDLHKAAEILHVSDDTLVCALKYNGLKIKPRDH